jgi:hypothetical protein
LAATASSFQLEICLPKAFFNLAMTGSLSVKVAGPCLSLTAIRGTFKEYPPVYAIAPLGRSGKAGNGVVYAVLNRGAAATVVRDTMALGVFPTRSPGVGQATTKAQAGGDA